MGSFFFSPNNECNTHKMKAVNAEIRLIEKKRPECCVYVCIYYI